MIDAKSIELPSMYMSKESAVAWATMIALEKTGVPKERIFSKARSRSVSRARGLVCALLRRLSFSYPEIGEMVGIDHTTAMYHCRKLLDDAVAVH